MVLYFNPQLNTSGLVTVAGGGTGASTAQGSAANLRYPYLLAQTTAAISSSNSTSEQTLSTFTIPAGAMGSNGIIELYVSGTLTSSVNNKQLVVRLGGVSGTILAAPIFTTNSAYNLKLTLTNVNSVSSQFATAFCNRTADLVATTTTPVASSIDTSVAVDIVIACIKATGTETFTVQKAFATLQV